MSRLYPIGIQYFEKIGEGKYAYVERLHGFINRCRGGDYYFLSRPCRSGKSPLVPALVLYYTLENRK